MAGDEHLRAPSSDITAWIEKQAVRNNLPAKRRKEKQWSCWHVLSKATQRSIEEHEQVGPLASLSHGVTLLRYSL